MNPYKILLWGGVGIIAVLGIVGISISKGVIAYEEYEMEYVMVTADEGILVNMAYRIPPKMPGMMGS